MSQESEGRYLAHLLASLDLIAQYVGTNAGVLLEEGPIRDAACGA